MIIIIGAFIILIIIIVISYNNKESLIMPDELENITYYDESNNIINHKTTERTEQNMAYEFIEPNDIVLELGGRYGTVSNSINNKLNNKTNHVVVEPDSLVIPALTKNRQNYQYYIENSYISNKNKKITGESYGKMMIDSDESTNKMTYDEFKTKYPLQFNVLVADCEGCICEFLDIMGDDINKINKIFFEADQPHMCDYNEVIKKLNALGFKEKTNQNGFHYLYVR
jgi:hypothetical protein